MIYTYYVSPGFIGHWSRHHKPVTPVLFVKNLNHNVYDLSFLRESLSEIEKSNNVKQLQFMSIDRPTGDRLRTTDVCDIQIRSIDLHTPMICWISSAI